MEGRTVWGHRDSKTINYPYSLHRTSLPPHLTTSSPHYLLTSHHSPHTTHLHIFTSFSSTSASEVNYGKGKGREGERRGGKGREGERRGGEGRGGEGRTVVKKHYMCVHSQMGVATGGPSHNI